MSSNCKDYIELTNFIVNFDKTKKYVKYTLDKYEIKQVNEIKNEVIPEFEHAYLLCSQPIYLVQWFLSIMAIYPLPVVVIDHPETLEVYEYFLSLGFSKDEFVIVKPDIYMTFLNKVEKNVYCINCGCSTTLPQIGNLKISNHYRSIAFSHGCDEDELYRDRIILPKDKSLQNKYPTRYEYERWPNRFHTSFSKPTLEIQRYTIQQIKNNLKLDPKRKTVLIIETNHPWGWCFINKRFAHENVCREMEKQIIQLSKAYNVILRLHPMDTMSYEYYTNLFDELAKNVRVVRTQEYPQFTPFIQMADIIIGSPNGVVCTALCCMPEKPIVELIPHKTWNGVQDFDKLRKQNGDLMINYKHVIVQYENDINLSSRISEAFQTIESKIPSRKKYIATWYTPIDKYSHILQLRDILHLSLEKTK
jgi:hypothetical protein